jgi:hypothetical protein
MGTSGKKKTTMAKLARESRLRERRMLKQAKKNDRRSAPASTEHPGQHEVVLTDTALSPTGPAQAALEDVGLPSGEA